MRGLREFEIEDYDDLIHTIYGASIDPRLWPSIIDGLSHAFGETMICLQGHDRHGGGGLGLLSSLTDPAFLASYEDYYAVRNVWASGMTASPVGRPIVAEELVSRDDLLKTEFYNDCLRTQGVVSSCGIILHRDATRFLFLSGNIRLSDADHLPGPMRKIFGLIGPHIARSFELMRRIPGVVDGEDYRTTVETLADAVFLIDGSGRVIHTNASAAALRLACSVVTVGRDSVLHFCDSPAEATFQSALGTIASKDHASLQGDFQVRQDTGALYRASIAPLRRSGIPQVFDRYLERDPMAVVVISAISNGRTTALDAFGLTPAEKMLAEAITQGMALRDYADSREISIHTVRTQLKMIYAKTETHRQSQLAALILGTPH